VHETLLQSATPRHQAEHDSLRQKTAGTSELEPLWKQARVDTSKTDLPRAEEAAKRKENDYADATGGHEH
jgi:hypothetical protein